MLGNFPNSTGFGGQVVALLLCRSGSGFALLNCFVLKLYFTMVYVEQILVFCSWISMCLAVFFFRIVW